MPDHEELRNKDGSSFLVLRIFRAQNSYLYCPVDFTPLNSCMFILTLECQSEDNSALFLVTVFFKEEIREFPSPWILTHSHRLSRKVRHFIEFF